MFDLLHTDPRFYVIAKHPGVSFHADGEEAGLMSALRARDRVALVSAKQQVLEAAFRPHEAPGTASAATAPSPALRRALRDLSWRMAALLLPRSPGC